MGQDCKLMEGLNLHANVSLCCKKKEKRKRTEHSQHFQNRNRTRSNFKDRKSTKYHSKKLITYALGVYVHLPWTEYYDGKGSSIKKEKKGRSDMNVPSVNCEAQLGTIKT